MSNTSTLSEARRGQIAWVYVAYKMAKDGLKLQPQAIRSDAGNLVKILNQIDPSLNVSMDEILIMVNTIIDLIQEKGLQPTRSNKATKVGFLA